MSKLIENYNKSIFANIGNKVSKMQSIKIPDNIKVGEFKTKDVLDLQKDFFKEVVLPYGTILEEQSNFGKIIVNPTKSIVDLFTKITNDVSQIVPISTDSNLLKLNSIYDDIKDANETYLLNSTIPTLNTLDTTSILKFNINDINLLQTTPLLDSDIPDYKEFATTSVLKFNSKFDDIVEAKTTSVLDFNSKFNDISELPYSNILNLNSKFDDLIIKDIGSILKVYMASNLPSTVPGVVDFFENIYATGFTPGLQQGQSLYDISKIRPYNAMPDTPNKQMGEIIEMPSTPEKEIIDIVGIPETPEKTIADIVEMPKTPNKEISKIVEMPDTPTKSISDINPPADTLEKPFPEIVEMPGTPDKTISNIIEMPDTPEKFISEINFPPETPEKIAQILSNVNYIPDINATGFTLNREPLQSEYNFDTIININEMGETPDKLLQAKEPGSVNFFPDDKAVGFTINRGNLLSEYNFQAVPGLEQFDFNDDSYGGVLNQYAVYFSKYPPLTNVTYQTVIDWAYNRTIQVPNALALYEQGFHTPTVPIGTTTLIIPSYQNANDRLPTWANTYLTSLEQVGSTLVAGYLSQTTIDLLDTLTDADLAPWKKSPLVFHQLAGEIYWTEQNLGLSIRTARESLINIGSNIFGRTLTEYFVPKVEDAIAGAIAGVINNTFGATILNDDKILMLYHILMGTKYTKSKAFFDRLAGEYSSKHLYIGDNAVNIYNDKYTYSDGGSALNTLNSVNYAIPYVNEVASTINALGIELPTISSYAFGQLENVWRIAKDGAPYTAIPIGLTVSKLHNPYIFKKDSKTFGTYTEERPYYSIDTPIETKVYTYDGPILTGSINRNYPEEKNAKTDLNALTKDTISDFNSNTLTLSNFVNDFNLSRTALNVDRRENSYSFMLRNKIKDKLLQRKGFAVSENQYSDAKNRLNLIKMPKSTEDTQLGIKKYEDENDLIDFYFEDLSTLSDTNESIVIPFKAILTTITNGTNANWAAQDYMGRADKFWIYQGFERRVAINFDVAINSKDEFVSSWRKINYLQGLCYPVAYPGEISFKAPIMALTVGNLFDRIQVIMNSMNYSFDGSTLWEIEKNFQLPMYIKIAVDFTVIFADIPRTSARHIGQSQEWMNPKVYDESGNEQSIKNAVKITETETGENITKKEETADDTSARLGWNIPEELEQFMTDN